MSAFGRPYDRAALSDITNRSGQHQHVNYSYSPRLQDSEAQLAANVMGNQHRPHIKRLEMQGSAGPSELNCRYNARTAKNIVDSRGPHSWLDANPEVYKMMQTSLELLMSRSRKIHPPNLPDCTYGGELQKVTNSQVHGIAQPSDVHKMVQTSLEMEMLMSQSRNVCPANLPGSTYGGESASVASPQVDGTTYLYRGIDDDLPPPNLNSTDMRGTEHVSGNGRAITPTSSYDTAQTAMEAQIHQLEQEAYCSVLRAFKAQSDTITWEKEGLITELREELRVSDEEHRQLLNKIYNDDFIRSISEWRSKGRFDARAPNNPMPGYDPLSIHTTSTHKRQKTSQPLTASPAPSPLMHSQQVAAPTHPSSSTATKEVPPGPKGKRLKTGQKVPGGSAVKSMPSSEGLSARRPHLNRYFPGCPAAELSQAQNVNPLIGHKAMNRWPDDNNFYEVVISDYNQETGLYALVHDMNTSNETWEWVDLKKMGQEDIRWQEDGSGIDPVMYLQSQGARTSGAGKSTSHGGPKPVPGRGISFQKNVSKKDFLPPQNVDETRSYNNINIFHTGSLIKVVKKIFSVSNPDPLEVERAKKALEDQERSLVGAIARLAEASDVESG
ncbi:protein EMSY-LIKE 3-like isoform X3 [Miscanthus floridulus]|uniref:protein EMSY-LIKE 3-like isoform X3 n=1 Tax=Miscanthus floridulus TaxID=154761 RepID=UPI00345B0F42